MENDSVAASFLVRVSGSGAPQLLEELQLADRRVYLSSTPISPNHMGGVGDLLTFVCTPGELAHLIEAVAALIVACRANINLESIKIEPVTTPPQPDPRTAAAIARLIALTDRLEESEGTESSN